MAEGLNVNLDDKGEAVGFDIDHASQHLNLATLETEALPVRSYKAEWALLKLLQKSYTGKIKLIYIDPPYKTGKDFICPDNYCDNIRNNLDVDVFNATCSQL